MADETPADDWLAKALAELRREQSELKKLVDYLTRDGDSVAARLNECVERTAEYTRSDDILERKLARLEREIHPVGRMAWFLLVVGSVVVTNTVLALLGVSYPTRVRTIEAQVQSHVDGGGP